MLHPFRGLRRKDGDRGQQNKSDFLYAKKNVKLTVQNTQIKKQKKRHQKKRSNENILPNCIHILQRKQKPKTTNWFYPLPIRQSHPTPLPPQIKLAFSGLLYCNIVPIKMCANTSADACTEKKFDFKIQNPLMYSVPFGTMTLPGCGWAHHEESRVEPQSPLVYSVPFGTITGGIKATMQSYIHLEDLYTDSPFPRRT